MWGCARVQPSMIRLDSPGIGRHSVFSVQAKAEVVQYFLQNPIVPASTAICHIMTATKELVDSINVQTKLMFLEDQIQGE